MKIKIGISILLSAILVICSLNLCPAQPFTPATPVVDAVAYNYVNQFKEVYKKNVITGGVITKAALDSILRTPNCNSITYRFGMDTTGTIAPKNEIFIILSGGKATEQSGVVNVDHISAPKYLPRHWCPPSCMSFIITDKSSGVQVTVE